MHIRFKQAAGQFSTRSLLREHRTLAAPLRVFGRFAGHELPEKEVDNSRTHRFHGAAHAVRPLWNFIHAAILFEHIFEHKGAGRERPGSRHSPVAGPGCETIAA